jgi:hypothetical protein
MVLRIGRFREEGPDGRRVAAAWDRVDDGWVSVLSRQRWSTVARGRGGRVASATTRFATSAMASVHRG